MSNSMSSFWSKPLPSHTAGVVVQLLSQTLTKKTTEGKAELLKIFCSNSQRLRVVLKKQVKVSVCVHAHMSTGKLVGWEIEVAD